MGRRGVKKGRRTGFKVTIRYGDLEADITQIVEDFIEGVKEEIGISQPKPKKKRVVYREKDGTQVIDLRELDDLKGLGRRSRKKKEIEGGEENGSV